VIFINGTQDLLFLLFYDWMGYKIMFLQNFRMLQLAKHIVAFQNLNTA
jgi:hypothetical protein